jgi:hypothetical protein
MVLTLVIYPFPKWVTQSGYVLAAVTVILFFGLFLLKGCFSIADAAHFSKNIRHRHRAPYGVRLFSLAFCLRGRPRLNAGGGV